MSGLRAAAVGCFGVTAVMLVLLFIGTYDEGLFYTWLVVGALALAAGLWFAKLDDSNRRRRLDEERRHRLGGGPTA